MELTLLARGHRRLFHRHPWIGALGQLHTLGPNAVRTLEYAIASVDNRGLDIDRMMDLVSTTIQFTRGFVQEELAELEAQRNSGLDGPGWHAHMAPFLFDLLKEGEHPYLEWFVRDAEDFPEPTVVFERRLLTVLDGLAASLDIGKGGTTG